MKNIIFFLFPIFFFGQNNKLKTLYSKNFNSTFCSFKYRNYEREDLPYKAIGIEEVFAGFSFCAYLKNADIPMVKDCTMNKAKIDFFKYASKDKEFEKNNLLIYINDRKVTISEKIGLLNIPEKLILFEDSKFQYIVFQITEFLTNTSYYSRPEATTIVMKFDKKKYFKDSFEYKSSRAEEIKIIYKRYLKKDKIWK